MVIDATMRGVLEQYIDSIVITQISNVIFKRIPEIRDAIFSAG